MAIEMSFIYNFHAILFSLFVVLLYLASGHIFWTKLLAIASVYVINTIKQKSLNKYENKQIV